MSSETIPEWAMEEAGKIADVWQHPMHHDHQILSQDIALALLAAERRGLEKAAVVAIPREVIDRYYRMVPATIEPKCEPEPGTSSAHIKWMLLQLYEMRDFGKAMRWLGFIQGILIGMRGYTTVKAERDFTRPFFTAAIRSLGDKT